MNGYIDTSLLPQNTPSVDSPLNPAAADSVDASLKTDALPPAALAQSADTEKTAAAQLHTAARRMQRMIDTAMRSSKNILQGLDANLQQTLAGQLEKPGLFTAARRDYRALMNAAKSCDKAAAAFTGLSTAELRKSPLTDKAFKALQQYTEAQNKMIQQTSVLQEKGRLDSVILAAARQAAVFRSGEALNFVASMQLEAAHPSFIRRGAADYRFARNAAEGLQMTASRMHGSSAVLRDMSSDAAALFAQIDSLEGQKAQMDSSEFTQIMNSLQTGLTSLKDTLTRFSTAHDGNAQGLVADRQMMDAVHRMLQRSSDRLDSLTHMDTLGQARAAYDQRMTTLPQDGISRLHKSGIFADETLAVLTAYNRYVNKGRTEMAQSAPDAQSVDNCMHSAQRLLHTEVAKSIRQHLKILCTLADNPALSENDLKNLMPDSAAADRAQERAAAKLYKDCLESAEVRHLLDSLNGSCLIADHEICKLEREAVNTMLQRAKTPPRRGDYIHAAFAHSCDTGTLLEAARLGIPTDQLELKATDSNIITSRVLGHGAANTVELCVYRGQDGEDNALVFKPEVAARRGLGTLRAGMLGYRSAVQVMQLNVAASRCADMIGCGRTIARSSIGTHNGRLGLFMESAKGNTGKVVCGGNPCCVTRDGMHLNFRQACYYMKNIGVMDNFRANLMREFSNLEWADALSGQVDRHRDNYLIDINPENGSVKVTGIDNDASFSVRKVGMTTVDLSDSDDFPLYSSARRLRDNLKGSKAELQDNIFDLSAIPTENMDSYPRVFGFNQLFKPVNIDRATYDKLTGLNPDDYERDMLNYMDAGAAHAARLRLIDAQNYAQHMKPSQIIDNWKDDSVMKDSMDAYVGSTGDHGPGAARSRQLRNGFFLRDFAFTFKDMLKK